MSPESQPTAPEKTQIPVAEGIFRDEVSSGPETSDTPLDATSATAETREAVGAITPDSSTFVIPATPGVLRPSPEAGAPEKSHRRRNFIIVGGAAVLTAIAVGVAGALGGGNRTAAVPAPVPATSGPATPGPSPEVPTPSPSVTVETPSATPTTIESPTQKPTTPEKPSNEVLTNADTTELSPELIKVYEDISGKVESGDLTYEQVLKLSPAEQALVQQSLIYILIKNGATNVDISVCYMDDPRDKECNGNFASPDDSSKAIYGKFLGIGTGPLAYTDDSAMGLSETLDHEASRIIADAAFQNPHDSTAESRIGKYYDAIQRLVEKGKMVKFANSDITVEGTDGGKKTRIMTVTANGASVAMKFELMKYKIDGAKASPKLGLTKGQVFELARWELNIARPATS